MCHTALERVYDLEPSERTLENLQNLMRVAWSEMRMKDEYKHLFDVPASRKKSDGEDEGHAERDLHAEIEWGQSALQLLNRYVQMEDPQNVVNPNPLEQEIWVKTNLTINPSAGVTGNTADSHMKEDSDDSSTFLIRGIVDRIDLAPAPVSGSTESNDMVLCIIDYKTGKAPNLKYSSVVNKRILDEAFWQLKVYALIIREMRLSAGKGTYSNLKNTLDLRLLRLMYLNSEKGTGVTIDFDMGETETERDCMLQEVHADLASVWTKINELVKSQDPKGFVHCDRKFCWCHKVRPQFLPGTVWEREVVNNP